MAQLQEKERKKQATHQSNVIDLTQVRCSKPDESSWGVKELKIAIKATKIMEDGATPNKKEDMLRMWNVIRGRIANTVSTVTAGVAPQDVITVGTSIVTEGNIVSEVRRDSEFLKGELEIPM